MHRGLPHCISQVVLKNAVMIHIDCVSFFFYSLFFLWELLHHCCRILYFSGLVEYRSFGAKGRLVAKVGITPDGNMCFSLNVLLAGFIVVVSVIFFFHSFTLYLLQHATSNILHSAFSPFVYFQGFRRSHSPKGEI